MPSQSRFPMDPRWASFTGPGWTTISALGALLLGAGPTRGHAQVAAEPAEVRQIVTFLFVPGRAAEAQLVYQDQLRPIYQALPDLLRFRGYGEVESPEPLDLVVVSSYRGMAGMDRANHGLRRPRSSGPSALALYGMLSAMTQRHHDQFVEMIPRLSDSAPGPSRLTVFEYLRLVPGSQLAFEDQLVRLRAAETAAGVVLWSETGRLLVSDGWDYLRIFGIGSLGDWHRYLTELRGTEAAVAVSSRVAARKTILVRELPAIGVSR